MAPLDQASLQPRAAVHNPLRGAKFTLDSSGIAGFLGFFGGDMATRATATVCLLSGIPIATTRLHNLPGSFEMAQRFWSLKNKEISLPQLLGLDGKVGSKFVRRFNSLLEQTGHLASLFVTRMGQRNPGLPAAVTIINLPKVPAETVQLQIPSPDTFDFTFWASAITSYSSLAGCIGCALIGDWWNFSSILLGIYANAAVSTTLSMRLVMFRHPSPAARAPRGNGMFVLPGSGVVVIRGDEGAVNCITHGRFYLKHSKDKITSGEDHQRDPEHILPADGVGACAISVLLAVQFIAQLILVPQGVLLGQIMFIATLAISAAYNAYFSSVSEGIQADVLYRQILGLTEEDVKTFQFDTWTAMSTFAFLALQDTTPNDHLPNDDGLSFSRIWDALLPINLNTTVWERWREVVNERLRLGNWASAEETDPDSGTGEEPAALADEEDRALSRELEQAQVGYDLYLKTYIQAGNQG